MQRLNAQFLRTANLAGWWCSPTIQHLEGWGSGVEFEAILDCRARPCLAQWVLLTCCWLCVNPCLSNNFFPSRIQLLMYESFPLHTIFVGVCIYIYIWLGENYFKKIQTSFLFKIDLPITFCALNQLKKPVAFLVLYSLCFPLVCSYWFVCALY